MTIGWLELALYVGALAILFLTPGPVWLAITARALSGGFTAAWPLAIGVAIGDLIWPIVAILGLSWILSVFDDFLALMRLVACGVFILMGLLLIRNADHHIGADSRLTRPGPWAGLTAGLAVILGNPKAVLFYMGVLPGFFDLRHITPVDIALILAASMAVPLAGNLLLAASVDRVRRLVSRPESLRRVNIISGVLLVVVGVLIPLF